MKKTLTILLHLVFPIILYCLFIIIDFFINGSGISSSTSYEKHRFLWIITFLLLGIVQVIYILSKINLDTKYKYTLILIIILLYFFIVYKCF